MKEEKQKRNINKKNILRFVIMAIILAIIINTLYMIFKLIKQPTNVFVVENGKLTMEEEAIRICYT